MSIKGLDLLFDTDTLKNEEVEEINNFGLQLMELLEMKVKNMGLKIVDHNCITRV